MPVFAFRNPPLLPAGGMGFALSGFAAAGPVDFTREVLPVLWDRCLSCQGPDEKHRMVGRRLDVGFLCRFPGSPNPATRVT